MKEIKAPAGSFKTSMGEMEFLMTGPGLVKINSEGYKDSNAQYVTVNQSLVRFIVELKRSEGGLWEPTTNGIIALKGYGSPSRPVKEKIHKFLCECWKTYYDSRLYLEDRTVRSIRGIEIRKLMEIMAGLEADIRAKTEEITKIREKLSNLL